MKYIALTLLCAVLLSACGSSSLPIGQEVVVQFDRNSLGAGASLPVSPTAESINGAETAIRGKLLNVNESWVVLQVKDNQSDATRFKTFWIPKEKVLLIRNDYFVGH